MTNPEHTESRRKRQKPPARVTKTWLHNAGLFYLQRFAASTDHFRAVMTRKIDRSCRHHKDQERPGCLRLLENLIEDFKRAGLLDDAAYAQGAVRSLRRRGLSARAIDSRLRSRGLDNGLAAEILEQLDEPSPEEGDFLAALRLARRRRIGPFSASGKERNDEKSIAAFGRAGFDYNTAKRVISLDRQDAEDLLKLNG